MPREPRTTSVTLGALLRREREARGLSLIGASRRSARLGPAVPASTLAHIEQGRTDPGVLRLVQLLRLYDIPVDVAANLIELQDLQGIAPVTGNLENMYRRGREHFQAGNFSLALAHLHAIRQHAPANDGERLLRQKATLAFAVTVRELGRDRLALQLVDDLFCEPLDPSLQVEAFIIAASLWCRLGAAQVALAFIERAERAFSPTRAQQAFIAHQYANVYTALGQPERSVPHLETAIALYRELGDTSGEARATIHRLRSRLPPLDAASGLVTARELVQLTRENRHELLLSHALLELGRYLLLNGAVQDALEPLSDALARATRGKDHELEFHAHYQLWKLALALGDAGRARVELEYAMFCAQRITDPSAERSEILALHAASGRHEPNARTPRRRR